MEKKENGRTEKTPLQSSFFPATADSILYKIFSY